MIITSEERYVPVTPGYITLQDSDGVYYYIHKTFYEQAVVLQDRYGKSIDTLQKLIGGNPNYVAIEKYLTWVPEPLKIMGHFLALLQEDIEDFTDIIGAMDTMAEVVNLRALIMQPAAIRQQVTFDMSIDNIYRDRWDLFFQQCYEYDWLKAQLNVAVSPRATSAPSSYVSASDSSDSLDSDMDDADLFAQALQNFGTDLAEDLANIEIPEKKEGATSEVEGGSGLSVIAETKKRRRSL